MNKITKITYARLYNLGNFENERLEVEVTVDGADAAAVAVGWATAVGEVERQHAQLEAERQEAEQQRREENQAEQERRRTDREAARQQRPDSTDLPF